MAFPVSVPLTVPLLTHSLPETWMEPVKAAPVWLKLTWNVPFTLFARPLCHVPDQSPAIPVDF